MVCELHKMPCANLSTPVYPVQKYVLVHLERLAVLKASQPEFKLKRGSKLKTFAQFNSRSTKKVHSPSRLESESYHAGYEIHRRHQQYTTVSR